MSCLLEAIEHRQNRERGLTALTTRSAFHADHKVFSGMVQLLFASTERKDKVTDAVILPAGDITQGPLRTGPNYELKVSDMIVSPKE